MGIEEYIVMAWFIGMITSPSVADHLDIKERWKKWQRILMMISYTVTAPLTFPFIAAGGIIYLSFIAIIGMGYIAMLGIGVYVFVVVIGFMAKIAFG